MLKDRKLPGKRQILQALVASVPEAQGLQAARQTSQTPSPGCKRARSSRIASCQANVTKFKACKLSCKRHIIQALVVSVPEAQGLQAARQTSRSSRTASCQASVTLSKLWLPQGLQAARQTSHSPSSGCKRTRSSRTAGCLAHVTKLKDRNLPGKRHILQELVARVPVAQGLQAARQTSHFPSSSCMRTRSSSTASCQANVTNRKDCKLPGKRHILQDLVVSVPEAQGLQAARQRKTL